MRGFLETMLAVLFVAVILALLVIAVPAGFQLQAERRDKVCKEQFGEKYSYKEVVYSADFCVDDSGAPRYPKTWELKKGSSL